MKIIFRWPNVSPPLLLMHSPSLPSPFQYPLQCDLSSHQSSCSLFTITMYVCICVYVCVCDVGLFSFCSSCQTPHHKDSWLLLNSEKRANNTLLLVMYHKLHSFSLSPLLGPLMLLLMTNRMEGRKKSLAFHLTTQYHNHIILSPSSFLALSSSSSSSCSSSSPLLFCSRFTHEITLWEKDGLLAFLFGCSSSWLLSSDGWYQGCVHFSLIGYYIEFILINWNNWHVRRVIWRSSFRFTNLVATYQRWVTSGC